MSATPRARRAQGSGMGGSRALLVALALVPGLACDVIAPPEPPPEPPPRGYYVSQPFDDVRVLADVVVLAPGLAFAVGSDGTVATFDGTSWTREESGVTADLEGIAGFIASDGTPELLAVGALGTVIHRGAAGTWEVIASGVTEHLFSVWLRSATDGFIVGERGTVLRWSGTAVTPQLTQTRQLVVGADGTNNYFPIAASLKAVADSEGQMFAVGSSGAIYCYDATGDPNGFPAAVLTCDNTAGNTCPAPGGENTWQLDSSGTTRNLAGLAVGNGTYAPTTDGVLLERVNGPCPAPRDDAGRFTQDNWNDDFRVPTPAFLHDVWRDSGLLFAVGLSPDLFQFDGGTWTLVRVADEAELRAVHGTWVPPGDAGPEDTGGPELLAVGGGGRVVRGPRVLPLSGETLLAERPADEDFTE
ncbi:MAG: hypothetical protein HYS27_17025 [Deltaproteobacteria bacterium]|nr:hypothetical protein [Deltaproteobacteria bacterium]